MLKKMENKSVDKVEFEKERFEFLLLINGNIICQRYFAIRNYNDESTNSLEMKELAERLVGMNNGTFGTLGLVPDFLKEKSKEYLWGYFKPYVPQTKEDINRKNIFEKEDIYGFEVRVDGNPVCISEFSGNFFPPKVRYQVDIREIIPDIISEIRYYLSKKAYTTSYGDIKLKYEVAPYDFEV